MARKVLTEGGYSFTASTKTVVINKSVPRENLILITNVTTGQVIYNFSDPSLKATSYTVSSSGANATTTIILNYNTLAMSNSDKLSIVIDEYVEQMAPAETILDPVNKMRVSEPQSLIDTDFEYGPQTTKWENISLVNNRPFAYDNQIPLTNVTAITMNANARLVTVATTTPPAVGTPVFIRDSNLPFANGNFIVETQSAGTNFTYTARSVNYTSITALFDASKTVVSAGTLYTSARIGGNATISVGGSDLRVGVTTTVPHGLSVGNEIAVRGITGTNPPNGNFYVSSVTSPTVFAYFANPTVGNPASLGGAAEIYARPQSQVVHRPFDGGVMFGTYGSSNNVSQSRQTRRYFRYQSGKGIQTSSGTILRPYATVDQITSSGTTVTVTTREAHGMQPGVSVTVSNCVETAYNGTFTVVSCPRFNTFTYTALSTPSASPASGDPTVSVNSWSGAKNRLGVFDQQNGLFWEYDGQQLYAVRRSSVYQVGGRISVTAGANTVTQTDSTFPTAFAKQLVVGDWVTIRGHAYRVIDIASDTSMTISPSYRGTSSVTFGTLTKMVDLRIPQSSFNLDKIDGTGPSGYNIDLSKMQMFYIDYSWYGAGFVRWGVRGPEGDVIYVHKLANNNVNSEAYMRSGNLPARYETVNESPYTQTTATVGSADTTLSVRSTAEFPSSGTLIVRNGSVYEGVNYTGKTATTFTGLTRGQAGSAAAGQATTWTANTVSGTVTSITGLQVGQRVHSTTNPNPVPEGTFVTSITGSSSPWTITLNEAVTATNPNLIFAPIGNTAQTFTFSATAPTTVELLNPSFAPSISHWGTSVIMDGKFDDDKSLVFTFGQSTGTAIAGTSNVVATSGSSSGTTVTVASTANLVNGQTVTVTAGTGAFAGGTTITAVNSGTQFTVSATPSTILSGATITATGASTKALMSIRVAPSADNGQIGSFGVREIVNRMQLKLNSFGITPTGSPQPLLVTAVLNGTPSSSTAWTNAVGNAGVANSSLAQIASYAGGTTTVSGGEVAGGFFVQGTDRLDLTTVRDLGNSILGGGLANSNAGIYPDGPDTITILVQNLGTVATTVFGRLGWTEAQA
jgi:hypothetical protein